MKNNEKEIKKQGEIKMSKKYAITYVVKSTRTAIITADSEEEAENMIEQDYDYYDFTEEDTEFYDIEDIEEISDNDF